MLAGTVREIFMRRVTRTLAEHRITREGNPANPVYLVEHGDDGDECLKTHAEVRPQPFASSASSVSR